MAEPDETEGPRPARGHGSSDDDLLALITRIESENPRVAAAALASEVDLILGRLTKPTKNAKRASGHVPRGHRGNSTVFAWYQAIVAQLPPLLDHDETIAAAKKIEIGVFAEERLDSDDPMPRRNRRDLRTLAEEGHRAFDTLMLSNLRLVFHWAKGATVSVGEDWVQDAFQAGCIGLMRGLQGWDYSKGYRLSTFVSWHIRQQIQRWRMNETSTIRVPVHVWEKLESEATHDRADAVLNAARLALNVSFLEDLTDDDIESLERMNGADDPLIDVALHIERRQQIDELLRNLDERAERVIRLRNSLGDCDVDMTLDAIGEIFGVTRERIRQIEKKAMEEIGQRARQAGLDQLI